MINTVRIKNIFIKLLCFICMVNTIACKQDKAIPLDEYSEVKTPVTITTASNEPLSDYIELSARSVYLQKSYAKVNTSGYIEKVFITIGTYVQKGMTLFTLRTKESQSIGNSITNLDSTFKFSGVLAIKAYEDGYVTQLNYQTGDYVQEGEQLAVISNINSFAFILDLPYEYNSYLSSNKNAEVILPDGSMLKGIIGTKLPEVDSVSQTQKIIVKVNTASTIPENLIAKVRLVKYIKTKSISLPKSCVLTNESQNKFWIMKLVDDSTAVKIEIEKGIETSSRIEIISPELSLTDKFLLSGNYGLSDTAKVTIVR
ncbi:hypothetical protein BH11BAC2_BH11BAC2_17410 [soil metagenome]